MAKTKKKDDSKTEKTQRREFYRMALEIDIYYKAIEENEAADIGKDSLIFELVPAKNAITDGEYQKLTTTDLSAGGFRCCNEIKFEEGALLNCMLIAGYEALPVVAQILKSQPDAEKPDLYDTRAIFYELNDQIRDRVVRYIFSKQRQAQSKLHKRKI